LKPIKVKLFSVQTTLTTGAAAALSWIVPVTFASATFPEIAAFTTLYDECRVLGVKVHYTLYEPAPGTAPSLSTGAVAIGFDPTAGTPSSTNNVMEESYMEGPLLLGAGVNNNSRDPTLSSYRIITAKPPAMLAPITSSDCPGKAWFCVDGTTPPTIFTWQGYFSALAGPGTLNYTAYFELDAEFKLRT
jgi:hypothetical protein